MRYWVAWLTLIVAAIVTRGTEGAITCVVGACILTGLGKRA